jgi:ligand-binding sensor domain-containing protein
MVRSAKLHLFLALGLGVSGVLPGNAAAATSTAWKLFDKTDGLAGNTVQAIVADADGELWVGTREGLSRFDGQRWQSFTAADGLPDEDVHSLAPEVGGGLWVGAGNGFGRIAEGRWSRLGLPGDAGQRRGKVAVATDRAGITWLGFGGGLLRFDRTAGVIEPVAELTGRQVSALLADREGGLWAAVGGDLWRSEGGSWGVARTADALPSGPVTALLEDSRGVVWCGGERGVAEYDGSSWRPARFGPEIPAAAATALAEDGEGRVWLGTRAGAGYSDGYEWHWFDARSGLPADEVLSLSADRNGSIWAGTTRGIARFDTSWSAPAAARRAEIAPRSPLFRGPDGALYVATAQGFVVQRGDMSETVGPGEGFEARVRSFAVDAAGDLWVGSDQGLARYDGSIREQFAPEFKNIQVEREWGAVEAQRVVVCDRYRGLTGPEVTALVADTEGRLWVGTNGGLSSLHEGKWVCPGEAEGPGSRPVSALLLDERGVLWAGTADGLWEQDGEGWRRHDRSTGLAADEVTALLADRAGRIWAGTPRGLSRREGEAWVTLDARQGLVSDRVLTLFEDARGRLWVGTQEGVSCHEEGLWSSFGEQDGLPSPRISSITETDGRVWFGADEGVRIHRPDRSPPRTRIKNPPAGIVAAPFYLFEFVGGDLETPAARLRYSWRVDGGAWSPWSSETLATVKDLANGRHQFEVRSLDGEFNADPTPAAVAFEVNTKLFDLELVEVVFSPLYVSLHAFYADETNPAQGRIAMRSRYDRPLRVKVSAFLPELMDFPTDAIVTMPPGELVTVPVRVELSDRALDVEKTESRQLRLTLQYAIGGERKEYESTVAVTVVEKHGMSWEEPERIGLYVTHLDEAVERFARETVRGFREVERGAIVYEHLMRAIELFDALGAHGMSYLPDPGNPYGGIVAGRPTLDTVRLPRETLRARTGDCDDLAVLYAALLQNIGIDTALVDVLDHVFVMFDTGLTAQSSWQLTRDAGLLHIDARGRVWVPVETTLVGKSFSAAWASAAATLASRSFTAIDIQGAWKKYAPLRPREPAPDVVPPPFEAVRGAVAEDLRRQEEGLKTPRMVELEQRIAANPTDADAINALGVQYARRGYLGRAAAHFEQVIALRPDFAGGYSNLGNVLSEQGRFAEAVQRYEESLARAELAEVHVELALALSEIGKFDESRKHYERARELGAPTAATEAGAR